MPQFSVIVPVYNTEKYLRDCIDSILAQSFTDFELILVDDGSPDSCGKICDDYARKDSRIRVFHKLNGGVSSARNLGLDNAQGEFICFIDSDDTIGPDYLKTLVPQDDEDFVQSGVKIAENDYLKPFMTHEEIFSDYNRFWMESRQQWPGLCSLSKKIIDMYHLRYDTSLRMGEDGLFNHIFLSKCKKIRRTTVNEYYYNGGNAASASHKYYPDRLEQQECLVQKLEEHFKDEDIQRVRWDYWHEVINHYQVKGISNTNSKIHSHALKKIKQCYQSMCFRKCLPYIKKEGTLDEKLEAAFMGGYTLWMYRPLLKMIQTVSQIKHKIGV